MTANILLVYPKFSTTYWGFKFLLKLISRKAALPPLGLLTVAAMLPGNCQKKLVDMNVCKLSDRDLEWADYVFVSAMATQKESAKEVIAQCVKKGIPVVLGGPIAEMESDEFPKVTHFFKGETEETIAKFFVDLGEGRPKKVYLSESFPDLGISPAPLWELVNPNNYASMLVQFGRGCPFKCTFCDVAKINGRNPRVKSSEQFLLEIDKLYAKTGFIGAIMFADDNLIGNRKAIREMLPKLIVWQKEHGHPFKFIAEVDITISDDSELMDMMVEAGFIRVFLGIETPNKASLIECGKMQNVKRDLVADVKKILNHGLVPMSGFIVGFDNDNPETFADEMIDFIQKSGIIIAMVGVLQAIRGSQLHAKLQQEGRLLDNFSGNNTDCYPNFITKMPVETLIKGYKKIWKKIYSPRGYYERIRIFFREYNTVNKTTSRVTMSDISTFAKSIWHTGLFGGPKTSYYYWKTLLLALFQYPKGFAKAVGFQVFGSHFQRFAKKIEKS